MFSHIDANGNAKMVDVTKKGDTLREAIAMGSITLNKEIIKAIIENKNKKGDVLSTSKIAGIQAAKKNS
jgi:cyclic pyranopterin phosphate synthase